jgi:hypothetical protein
VEHIGWEAIFLINVPIGIAAVWVTLRRVTESRDPGARGVDWAGLVTFSAALFLLVFALVRGNAEGWGSALIEGFLIGAGVLWCSSCSWSAARNGRCSTSRSSAARRSWGVSLAAFALSAGMFSVFLYLTLYLQNALGYDPLETGLRFLPITVLSFVGRAGRRQALGARAAAGADRRRAAPGRDRPAAHARADAASGWTALLAGLHRRGAGIGMTNPPLASTPSASSSRSAAGWPRASTTRSARWASRRARRAWARSSSICSRTA